MNEHRFRELDQAWERVQAGNEELKRKPDYKTTFNNGLLLDYRSARTQLPACQWHDDPFYVIKDGVLYRAWNARGELKPVRTLEAGTVVRLWDEEAENPILGTI